MKTVSSKITLARQSVDYGHDSPDIQRNVAYRVKAEQSKAREISLLPEAVFVDTIIDLVGFDAMLPLIHPDSTGVVAAIRLRPVVVVFRR